MPSVLRSAAVQAMGWLLVIVFAAVASSGPMFAGAVPTAVVAVLMAGCGGVVATVVGRAGGLWTPAAFVVCPVLASSVAAAVSAPTARMLLVSAGVSVVALAVWWLHRASGMPRWPATLTSVVVVAVIAVDLLFRDPYRELRCHPLCVSNPWGIARRNEPILAAGWVLAVVTVSALVRAAIEVVRRPPARWRAALVLAVSFVAVAGVLTHLRRGDSDPGSDAALRWTAVELWAIASAATVALTPAIQQRMARQRALHWVSGVEASPSGETLVELMRASTGDASVRVLPVTGSHSTADTRTTISRKGLPVAVIEHQPASADRVRAMLSSPEAAALENEILLLTAQQDLDELRSARRAVIERSDSARRSLQRDLHDGAQQRLIVLALELSTMASRASGDRRDALMMAADHAEAALAGLRRVAHGDLPPILHDEGLAEALVSLAEQSTTPLELRVSAIEGRRFPPEIERVAYHLVTTALGLAASDGGSASVAAVTTSPPRSHFVITLSPAALAQDLTIDDDLVGTVGGSTRNVDVDGRMYYEARFPCG